MKEYFLRVLIASAAVIAVITYALFLNTRLSVGRYEVKKMGWRNSWAEFPKEPSKQVSNPAEKQTGSTSEQGKAESPTVATQDSLSWRGHSQSIIPVKYKSTAKNWHGRWRSFTQKSKGKWTM